MIALYLTLFAAFSVLCISIGPAIAEYFNGSLAKREAHRAASQTHRRPNNRTN